MKKEGKFKKEERLKQEARKISIREASAYSLSDGFGFRYITPFAVAMGATNKYIGMLTSIPSLLGNFAQLFTPGFMYKYSRKKIVFWGVLFQAIMWLALIAVGAGYFVFNLNSLNSARYLVLIYTLLTIFGAFPGPAWSSWMRDITTDKSRGAYFGNRSKIAGFIALVCMLIAGFILDYFKGTKIFIAFIILFSLAFIGRFISALLFTKQYEPEIHLEKSYYFSFWQFLKKMWFNNFGKFTIMLSLISFAAAVASPFFAVYLLENLQLKSVAFGYILYTLIIMSSSVTSLVFMTSWGKFTDKYGSFEVMKLCGIFIPFIPLIWFVSSLLIGKVSIILISLFFILEEGFSGFVWAGFNLAAGNYIYDAVTKERMGICTAYFNILNGIAVFVGATLGGIIASMNFKIFWITPLLFVFLISFVLRWFVISFMMPKIKEVRHVKKFDFDGIETRASIFHPLRLFSASRTLIEAVERK